MSTTTLPAHPAPPAHPILAALAEQALQKAADASVWVLFRLDHVRSK